VHELDRLADIFEVAVWPAGRYPAHLAINAE
jgi:hypothetical protein